MCSCNFFFRPEGCQSKRETLGGVNVGPQDPWYAYVLSANHIIALNVKEAGDEENHNSLNFVKCA
jgi:hypothetical protein